MTTMSEKAARAASTANMRKQLAAAGMTEQEPADRPATSLTGAALARASMIRELRAQGMEPVSK